jgi:hypothetical protein
MPDSKRHRDQAARYDRIADQCTIPELVPYYRRLAEDFRLRAGDEPCDQDERPQADESAE